MDIKEYNGTSLAYMGDAVMSLLVREMLLAQGWQKSKILQKKSESWVSAKAQAYFLIQLKERAFSVKRNMQSSCADAIPIPQARQKMRM